MNMGPGLRKFALTAHIVSSLAWLGAVFAYAAIVLFAMNRGEVEIVRTAWSVMDWIGWRVLFPLSLTALLTGLIQALGTAWGLFRHYWVLFKFLLTILAASILLGNMQTVSQMAADAAKLDMVDMEALRSQLLHAAGGAALLLANTVLSVYKPRGLTRHGWRKQQEPSLKH